MGLKLIVVCGLALLMLIPALFVWLLVEDRTRRAADVITEISDRVGGQQTFLGPTLAIPWVTPPTSPSNETRHGIYLVAPAQASGVVNVATEERHRSLFKVPIFRADATLDASFDLTGVPANAPPGAQLDWSQAELVVSAGNFLQTNDQFNLVYGARRFKRRLDQLAIPHRYEEFDDNHSAVDYRMDESLPFLAKALAG